MAAKVIVFIDELVKDSLPAGQSRGTTSVSDSIGHGAMKSLYLALGLGVVWFTEDVPDAVRLEITGKDVRGKARAVVREQGRSSIILEMIESFSVLDSPLHYVADTERRLVSLYLPGKGIAGEVVLDGYLLVVTPAHNKVMGGVALPYLISPFGLVTPFLCCWHVSYGPG